MKRLRLISLFLSGLVSLVLFSSASAQYNIDLNQVREMKKVMEEASRDNPNLAPYAKQSIDVLRQIEEMNSRKRTVPAPTPAIKPAAPKIAPTPLLKPTPVVEEVKKVLSPEEKIQISVQKRAELRTEAKTKFNLEVKNNIQDTNSDGISDEVETFFGIDPRKPSVGPFSNVEAKLYGLETDRADFERQCTLGVQKETKFSADGFTALAACPKNQSFTLYAIPENGQKIPLQTKTSSENYKIIFTVKEKSLPVGNYTLQVEPTAPLSFNAREGLTSVLGVKIAVSSKSVKVRVVSSSSVEEPKAKRIENVDITTIRDIKVFKTEDGRIHVSGIANIATMVIGTFESAIFTSAMLADVEGGYFEITSAKPLEVGDHDVVLFAKAMDEEAQSKPVKLSFSVLDPALHGSSEKSSAKNFPWSSVALAIGLVAISSIFFAFRKRS